MPDPNQITIFAKTNFRNQEVPFGIKTDDRRRHMYLIGKTGMGKTTLMENMVIQDIRNGHGVAFLDPHGDSIQRILDAIPSNRVNDVIYFNPADMEYPVAFNILESVDPKFKHLVASGLMGVFTKIWANLWSARMEYILNNTILALLDSPGNTLLGITRMYVDKKYRKKIVDNIKDPMVRAFWVDEFANYNEKYRTEAIAPIQNKVGQFLSSGIIRNIVGQPKSTIDLREVMDNQKILIMDLSKGKVGEDNSALLGAMLVTKIQLAAMSRTDIPESERKDFYLYVDEFQNFATDSFATILSEARKYRLNLIVGHQYMGQLVQERNTKVKDAVLGNVGTMVVFRIGAEDAESLVKEFEPIFTEVDMVNLPKYQILLKLMINGVASEAFSATTLAPSPEFFTGNSQKSIKVSRERYANPVTEVEEKISRWMGAEFHQGTAESVAGEEQSTESKPQQEERTPIIVEQLNQHIETDKQVIVHDTQVTTQTIQAPEVALPPISFQPQPGEKKNQISVPEHKKSNVIIAPNAGLGNNQKINQPQINNQRRQPEHPPHRQMQQPKRDHRNRNSDKQRQVRQREPQKPQNPIWETVATLTKEKAQKQKDKIGETVNRLLTSAVAQITSVPQPKPEPVQPSNLPATQAQTSPEKVPDQATVIKPGEVHKF